MDQAALKAEILEVMAPNLKQVGLSPDELNDDDNFLEKGILDSVGFLEFVDKIEGISGKRFDFSELDPSEFSTMSGLLKNIAE